MQKAKYLGVLLLTVGAAACGDTQSDDAGTGASGGTSATGGASHGGSGGTSAGAAGRGGAGGTSGSATSGGSAGATAAGGTGGAGGAGGASMTGGAGGAAAGGTSGAGGGAGAATGGSAQGGTSGGAGSAGKNGGGAGMGVGGAAMGGMGGGGAGKGGAGAGGTSGSAGKAGSGGGAGAGGSGGTGSCDTPPALSPLIGWASVSGEGVTTTTGGGNAAPTTVTDLTSFTNAVKGTNAAVIYVKGKLSPGKVNVGSNKTIYGLCGAEFHGHLELSGSTNVIVANLKLVGYAVGDCSLDPDYDSGTGCSSGNDAITVQKDSHHVWFDHCDISDGTDGNLDITNGANFVTVSWTKFHYTSRSDTQGSDSTGASGHRYSSLVGGTDNPSGDDATALNVTWHHDWWADHVVERMARVRFGRVHFLNDLWTSADTNYCVRAGKEAKILIENGVFANQKDPYEFNNSTDQGTANITVVGNDTSTATGTKDTGGGGPAIGTLPYTYAADAVNTVSAAVQSGAGPH